jgi:hypothetical protein
MRGCLIFLSSISFKTTGQENSDVYNFLPDLHNNSFTFLKSLGLYKNASLKIISSHCVYLQEERNLGKYISWSFWGQHARTNMHREGQNLTLQVNFSYRKRATPKIETIFLEFSKAKVIYRMSHQNNDNFYLVLIKIGLIDHFLFSTPKIDKKILEFSKG